MVEKVFGWFDSQSNCYNIKKYYHVWIGDNLLKMFSDGMNERSCH
ncbi:MAG: hypothetical protein QW372_03120 [Nitrososphaerales archaeon]